MIGGVLLKFEDGTKNVLLEHYQKTEGDIQSGLKIMREWLKQQPHLPDDISDNKLLAFVALNKFSLEKAKQKLDAYFTARTILPQYFNISPTPGSKMRESLKGAVVVPLPHQNQYRRIFASKMMNKNSDLFDPVSHLGFAFQIMDVLLEEDMGLGSIVIADSENFTLGHAAKTDFMFLKHVKVMLEGVYSGRVFAIHLLHVGPVAESVLYLAKTILKQKIMDRMVIHKNLESLQEIFGKDNLPKDWGGNLKSLEEMGEDWGEKLLEYKDHLDKLNSFKVDEKLRPKEIVSDLFEDLQGSFRKLEVD